MFNEVENMTDREKLLKLFDTYKMEYIETILECFFDVYQDDISVGRMFTLIKNLSMRLERKVDKLNQAKYVAKERATYLKTYLNGDMWKTEEIAKANIQPQIDNVQAIIDACAD